MTSRMHRALRLTAAAAAAGGLFLNLLNLGFMGWVVATGSTEALGIDPRLLLRDILVAFAWGVGFPVLALIMLVRIGERREVVMAALFLGVYAFWGGILDSRLLDEEAWWISAVIVGDALAHSVGIRFTQLFPRPLAKADLHTFGPRWFRRWAGSVLAGLLEPRIFWTFAIAFEAAFQLVPRPGPLGLLHLLVWLLLGSLYLYASYARGSEDDRRRIFWILEGVAVFLLVQVLSLALWAVSSSGLVVLDLRLWSMWMNAVSAWLTLGCFVMAVFYAGAFDSSLILRRTTILGLSAGLAVLTFVTLETLVEQLLASVLGLESLGGGVVGGVAAAVAFRPLWLRIDKMLGTSRTAEGQM